MLCNRVWPIWAATICISSLAGSALAAPVNYSVDAQGNVTWGGDQTSTHPIKDAIPPMKSIPGSILFYWTIGFDPVTRTSIPDPDYQQFSQLNTTGSYQTRYFYPPDNKINPIKDWVQVISDGEGHTSSVTAGAIRHNSPWAFFPYSDLPDSGFKIPDVAAFGNASITIYEAVDLLTYITSNSQGFANGVYEVGQSLDSLGVTIVNGMIPGVNGLYFATTPFLFDPNSATGYVPAGGDSALLNTASFEDQNGPLALVGIHVGVPEPQSLLLVALGFVWFVLLATPWRGNSEFDALFGMSRGVGLFRK